MASDASIQDRVHGEPEEPHDVSRTTPHHEVNYYRIFALLVVLTIITVLAAFALIWMDIHNEMVKVILALLIASIKASFVCLFFMHLKFEGKLIYLIMIVPLILTVLLVCALIPDIMYGTRFNPPAAAQISAPAGEH